MDLCLQVFPELSLNALCEVFVISDSVNRISSKVFVPCPRVITDSCQNLPKINQQRPRSKTTVGKPGDVPISLEGTLKFPAPLHLRPFSSHDRAGEEN